MNYTENYQLPQWVASDRVLMEDFNDANTKVDQALNSKLGFIKLKDVTTTQQSSIIQLDVSDISFGSYFMMALLIRTVANSSTGYLRVNNRTESTYTLAGNAFGDYTGAGIGRYTGNGVWETFLMFPMCNGQATVSILSMSDFAGMGYDKSLTFSQIRTFEFGAYESGSYQSPGSHVILWGMK